MRRPHFPACRSPTTRPRPLLLLALLLPITPACLLRTDLYEARKLALTDNDGDGITEVDGDCDDTDPATWPDAPELCDGADNDCDGETDEDATDATFWFRDADGDGHGDPDDEELACAASTGRVEVAGDCDDDDAAVNPGADEVPYDGIDNDCSDGDLADVDGDGVDAVEAGGTDCDDANPTVHPGATSTWASGATDNDCDGILEQVDTTYGATGWTGRTADAQAGWALAAAAGPLSEGEPLPFLVGAPYDATLHSRGGAVHLVLDAATSPEPLANVPTLESGGDTWFLGSSVEAGLVSRAEGDGLPETEHALVTATGWGGGTGATWLISLQDLASGELGSVSDLDGPYLTGTQEGDYLGGALALLGDVTGDGLADLAVSSGALEAGGISQAGLVGLGDLASWEGSTARDQDYVVYGLEEGHGLGAHVDVVPDVDGDGLDDVFLSANDGVLALILPGGATAPEDPLVDALWVLWGETPTPGYLRLVGDLDGDSVTEVMFSEDHLGAIFAGIATTPSRELDLPTAKITAETGYLGEPLGLGDLDGDGQGELWVSSVWDEGLGSAAGAIHVSRDYAVGAAPDYLDAPLTAVPLRAYAGLGQRVAPVGDVDGDGLDELLIGGPLDDEAAADAGVAILLDVPQ